MKNFLITGAAGFIGSNLAYLLAAERPEWNLILTDNLGYAGNFKNIEQLTKKDNIKFIQADIRSQDELKEIFDKESITDIFHLAAESHVDRSIMSAQEFVTTNVLGTQNLIDLARQYKVNRYIHISTDEVYGALGPEGKFTEETPLDPTSPYSASKAASDLMVLAACKTHGFNAVITRCSNNYGPYQFPEKLIPLFMTNALEDKRLPVYGNGQQVRHWIYVKDHCEALLAAYEQGKSGAVYNIGGPEESELSNLEVTKAILELTNKPESLIQHVTDRLAHDIRYAIDNSKAKKELNWTPKVNFKEGLELTFKWYADNQDWWKSIKTGEYETYYQKHYGLDA